MPLVSIYDGVYVNFDVEESALSKYALKKSNGNNDGDEYHVE